MADATKLDEIILQKALASMRGSIWWRLEALLMVMVATGMALTLCLSAWSTTRPKARYVIWPRIDQKTCFKCILAAGLIPIVIETTLENDQLVTNLEAIKAAIEEHGSENILAILSTASCFAPRVPDKYGLPPLEYWNW